MNSFNFNYLLIALSPTLVTNGDLELQHMNLAGKWGDEGRKGNNLDHNTYIDIDIDI